MPKRPNPHPPTGNPTPKRPNSGPTSGSKPDGSKQNQTGGLTKRANIPRYPHSELAWARWMAAQAYGTALTASKLKTELEALAGGSKSLRTSREAGNLASTAGGEVSETERSEQGARPVPVPEPSNASANASAASEQDSGSGESGTSGPWDDAWRVEPLDENLDPANPTATSWKSKNDLVAKKEAKAAELCKTNTKDGDKDGKKRSLENLIENYRVWRSQAQALASRQGHPNAAGRGNWSVLGNEQQGRFLRDLESHCHTEDVLGQAGFEIEGSSARAPRPDPKVGPKRKAVSIDCEFIGIEDPDNPSRSINTLAQLVALDALTGDILLDVLVNPSGNVTSFHEEYSGLSEAMFLAYWQQSLVVENADQARARLFEFIDQDTILIGHALHNDFDKLRMAHSRIVDPQILEKLEVESVSSKQVRRPIGLKRLCETLLGRKVQESPFGHDCVEDAFAPREVLLWWFDDKNKPAIKKHVSERVADRNVFRELPHLRDRSGSMQPEYDHENFL